MARRSVMNDRSIGIGTSGKTRKSAASIKPKAEAAASVRTAKRPMTAKEKKAEQKRREAELRQKEYEKIRKREEREKAALRAAGIEPASLKEEEEKGKKKGFFPGMKEALDDNKKLKAQEKAVREKVEARKKAMEEARTKAEAEAAIREEAEVTAVEEVHAPEEHVSEASPGVNTATGAGEAKAPAKKVLKGLFLGSRNDPTLPKSGKYWAYRRLYTALIGTGLVLVVVTVLLGVFGFPTNALWIASIAVGYVMLITGFVFDHFKIKPIVEEHRKRITSTKKSPKQIKHDLKALKEENLSAER